MKPRGRTWGHQQKVKTGWLPVLVDGRRGWRVGCWLTWFEPAQGWLWVFKP